MQHWSLEAPISPLERVETINFTLAFSLRAKKPSMYLRLASLTCDHHTQSNACRYSSTFFTDSSATNSCRDSLHYYDHLNCFRANGFDFDPYNGTKVPYVWKLVGGLSSPLWSLYRFIYHTNDSCGSEAGVDQIRCGPKIPFSAIANSEFGSLALWPLSATYWHSICTQRLSSSIPVPLTG